jgi:hypothetical protein
MKRGLEDGASKWEEYEDKAGQKINLFPTREFG